MSWGPVRHGNNRARGDQRQQKPQRANNQPHRGWAWRYDCQRILEGGFSRRFQSRLGFAESDDRAFDFGELPFELTGVSQRTRLRGSPLVRTARRSFGRAKLALFRSAFRLSRRHEAKVMFRHAANQPIVFAESLNETANP